MPPRSAAADPRSASGRPTGRGRWLAALATALLLTGGTWSATTWQHEAAAAAVAAGRGQRAAEALAATAALDATLRSVQLDVAMGLGEGRLEDLARAFDRTQRSVAEAEEAGVAPTALAGFEEVADAARGLAAGDGLDPERLADTSSAVSDALSALAGDPSVEVPGAQRLDQLGRAIDADAASIAAGIELLRSPAEERSASAGRVVDARRRAQALLAAAVPALPETARDQLDEIAELEVSDQLARELAALGDPVTAVETDSGADRLHDASGIRVARLAAVERELADGLVERADQAARRAEAAAARAGRVRLVALLVDVAALALLVGGTVAARRRARPVEPGAAVEPEPAETATVATATPGTAAPTSDAAPAAPSTPGGEPAPTSVPAPATVVAPGQLAALTAVVDRHQLLADVQLQVLEELARSTGSGTADAEQRRALVGIADRLAVRARRLDESLLVLAGVGRAQRPATSPALADLLDGAVVEAATEHPVDVDAPVGVTVDGAAALDLAHVVAELVANAAEHGVGAGGAGGAGDPVRVSARHGLDGLLRIVVRDPGGGLGDAELTKLSVRSTDGRPETIARALADGRLGLTVVAVLTARWGCRVRFGRGADGSTEARLEVPARLVVGEGAGETVDGPTSTRQEEAVGTTDQSPNGGAWGWSSDGDYRPAEGWTANGEYVTARSTVPDTLAGRVPEGADFDAGLASLLDRDEATTDA